jgi:hypothetical protein
MSVATPGRDVADVTDECGKLDADDQRNPGNAACLAGQPLVRDH